jgi:hypothetical protein
MSISIAYVACWSSDGSGPCADRCRQDTARNFVGRTDFALSYALRLCQNRPRRMRHGTLRTRPGFAFEGRVSASRPSRDAMVNFVNFPSGKQGAA